MAYRVFVLDPKDVDTWVELDCEDVDFTTVFTVATVSDITKRGDTMTKQIAFKATPVNNETLGNLRHLNRSTDFTLDNRLGFNYNALRAVDCLIYEDSVLLFRGSLRVTGYNVDERGNTVYKTMVTGAYIDFRVILSEKTLTDLSFADLKHRFKWETVVDSWEERTERFNTTTSQYEFKPFQKGSGYVYPYIDYGVTFQKPNEPLNSNKVHIDNFRPAVYVREYFDRIFKQPELKGYTYEIKGDQQLVDKFNSLVVPNNTEKVQDTITGQKIEAFSTGDQNQNVKLTEYYADLNAGTAWMTRAIQLQSLNNQSNILNWFGAYKGLNGCTFIVQRGFTAAGYAKVKFTTFKNNWDVDIKVNFQLVSRDFIPDSAGNFSDANTWTVVSSGSFNVHSKATIINKVMELQVPERTYLANSQLMLRMYVEGATVFGTEPILGINTFYTMTDAVLRFPKYNNSSITFDVQAGDVVTPTPVPNIKQLDFVRGVIGLFNFYVYTTKERPKHIVFETYNDYYSLAQPLVLTTTALDWTGKVDRTGGVDGEMNLKLPKSYLFQFKEDSDYINTIYKQAWNEVYGTFRFADTYGLNDEKKVESIFSPSPLFQEPGTGRVHPIIYTVDGGLKKPAKSNIRIMYYNGAKSCNAYEVGKDIINNNAKDIQILASGITKYPQVGNYLLGAGMNNMVPKEDLYWGKAKDLWFQATTAHQMVPTAYANYYRGQVSDLTQPDVVYLELELHLNELDITNLNLQVPVFLDLGEMGYGYFKVLSIEYKNKNTTSTVKLQKITT